MRKPARVSFLARILLFFVLSLGIAISFLAVSPTLFSSDSYAQDYTSAETIGNSFLNTDPGVPHNIHTLSQVITIDVLSAIHCQLTGMDPAYPNQPCLNINPETDKLGFVPTKEGENVKLGGIAGVLSSQISLLYTPTISSAEYGHYLADNFGIAKKTYAQPASSGAGLENRDGTSFQGLQPIFPLWKLVRDFAYMMLVLVFILIGVGVMLRIRIDPRTVMTIQNQIPRVIVAIVLITFSYAIAGLMLDLMWTGTYVGINAMTRVHDVNYPDCGVQEDSTFQARANRHLLETPIAYVNSIFHSEGDGAAHCLFGGGIIHISSQVSGAMGGMIEDIIKNLFGINGSTECSILPFSLAACASAAAGIMVNILMRIIIILAVLIMLFRVWWELLKAYVYILFEVIAAPIWIVMGLIPGRPLGFQNWIRSFFANVAVFPLTALLFVAARIFMDTFDRLTLENATDPNITFIPPLVGNPNMENFGTLLAFGVLLMAPTLLNLLREKLKVPGIKQGAAIGAGLAAGAIAPRAAGKAAWGRFTRRHNYQTGEEAGPLRSWVAKRASTTKPGVDKEGNPTQVPAIKKRYKVAQMVLGKNFGVKKD